MPYSFGRNFTFEFFPLREELASDDFEDLTKVTDSPTVYIFTERPSRADAKAGTGNVQSITTWTNTNDGRGKKIAVSAIDDPDPNGSKDKYEYYIAINFPLVDSGQVQTIIRLLPLQRVMAHASTADPKHSDLDAIHPNILSHFTAHKIDNAITNAKILIKASLKAGGFEWSEIWNPDALKSAISYKALAGLALPEVTPGNSWEIKHEAFKDMASSLLGSVKLKFDADGDGAPEEKEHVQVNSIRLVR